MKADLDRKRELAAVEAGKKMKEEETKQMESEMQAKEMWSSWQ